jgi:hypothetical protein
MVRNPVLPPSGRPGVRRIDAIVREPSWVCKSRSRRGLTKIGASASRAALVRGALRNALRSRSSARGRDPESWMRSRATARATSSGATPAVSRTRARKTHPSGRLCRFRLSSPSSAQSLSATGHWSCWPHSRACAGANSPLCGWAASTWTHARSGSSRQPPNWTRAAWWLRRPSHAPVGAPWPSRLTSCQNCARTWTVR